MSLRIRLILLSGFLVALVAVALSVLYLDRLLDSFSKDELDRCQRAGQQINLFLITHIKLHEQDYATPASAEETWRLWYDIASTDVDISEMLSNTMAQSRFFVQINLADDRGQILVSSDPARVGASLVRFENFPSWGERPFYRRLADLVVHRPDLEVALEAGSGGRALFTIQVVASTVLARDVLLPQIRRLAEVSGGLVLLSLLITIVVTTAALSPLKRIEQRIDRIVQGTERAGEPGAAVARRASKEFAAMEGKLNLLGQQYRGAQQDATDLRQNVDQLLDRLASQLDVATRLAAISRVTGGVAHEIKNPLNAIVLRLDLLRERLGRPEEELLQEIDIISKEVMRLDRVVKTFLDFSRPVEVHMQDLELAAVASEVADLMTPHAGLWRVGIEFSRNSGNTLIRGDPDMLKQAILNLVSNAIEAMKRQGGHLRLAVGGDGDVVTLEVSDTGPGIPPEARDKVFQLYFTTKSKGSGIGLAMTYRAVQLHNGTIEFTSESGVGTTFQLRLPARADHG